MSAIGNFSLAIRNEDGIDCASSLYLALFSGGNMMRRLLLSRLASLPFFALGASKGQAPPKKLKIMMKSAWGPDDPTRDLLTGRGHLAAAKVHGKCDLAGGLAAA
jgi:hypothetical protein